MSFRVAGSQRYSPRPQIRAGRATFYQGRRRGCFCIVFPRKRSDAPATAVGSGEASAKERHAGSRQRVTKETLSASLLSQNMGR
jgi:hypothetical protein